MSCGSQKRNFTKPWRLKWILLALAMFTVQAKAWNGADTGKSSFGNDDDLGQIIDDSVDSSQNVVVQSRSQTAALDAKQRRQRDELLAQYGDGKLDVKISSINPDGGPTTGNTKVVVRGEPFHFDMHLIYPNPKCKFGRRSMIVDATYITCKTKVDSIFDDEGRAGDRDNFCIVCERSPPNLVEEVVTLSVSLTGDFSDSEDSHYFRYYIQPEITAIYPQYGVKSGGTTVQVWGKHFLNFGPYTRCGFGAKAVQANFFNSTYLECQSPHADIVLKPTAFSISQNNQQPTRQPINYYYYNQAIVSQLSPNYGQDSGGDKIKLIGSNFNPFANMDEVNNSNDTFCFWEHLDVYTPLFFEDQNNVAYCRAPPNPKQIEMTFVEVTLNGKNKDVTDDNVIYMYYREGKITNMVPKEGPTRGGTIVNIYGIEFAPNKKVVCMFDDVKTRGRFETNGMIVCKTPPWPVPTDVSVSITYEGEDSRFKSQSFGFRYYETPVIKSIEPECGPSEGYTQVMIKGRNFQVMGFGKAKCLFNETIMNATIVDNETLLCNSPPLNLKQASVNTPYLYSNVKVTLNGLDTTTEDIKFFYYPELSIHRVIRNNGPMTGGTHTVLKGTGFTHPHVCQLTFRYGAIDVHPEFDQNGDIVVVSPQVAAPGALTIFASGNGQNYGADPTLHYRDVENTFTYTQDVYIEHNSPEAGPDHGGTKLVVKGWGFVQFQDEAVAKNSHIPHARFVDYESHELVGQPSLVQSYSNTGFTWYTPQYKPNRKCILQISFNGEDWQDIIAEDSEDEFTFFYYPASVPNSIEPRYGPVKKSVEALIHGKDFVCPDKACANLLVRFGDEEFGVVEQGQLISSSQIKVKTPQYPKPDLLSISLSFNGQDFEQSQLTYGYFDPFVLSVTPTLLPSVNPTKISLHGFGFIQPDDPADLKIKYTSPKGDIQYVGGAPYVVQGTYVDKFTIEASTASLDRLRYPDGSEVQIGDPIWPEVSTTHEDDFTQNQLPIYHYLEVGTENPDDVNSPQNIELPLIIGTNFYWSMNSFPEFIEESNFTCTWQCSGTEMVTQGRIETLPLGSQYNSSTKGAYVACNTPNFDTHCMGSLQISVNGQDKGKKMPYEFEPILELHRLIPQCGPQSGQTSVKMIGTGFKTTNGDVLSKLGTMYMESIVKSQVLNLAWNKLNWLNEQYMTETDMSTFDYRESELNEGQSLDTFVFRAPMATSSRMGGPVYASVGQIKQFEKQTQVSADDVVVEDRYYFSDSLVEYYYYRQPEVVKIEPLTGLDQGGTKLDVSGIWFDIKLEYGLVPMCKIGNKIVRAQFDSTVRITCITPPNEDIDALHPISISLNGVDWVTTDFEFTYYVEPIVTSMTPLSGRVNGGTTVTLNGKRFSSITDPDMRKCRWTLVGSSNDRTRPHMVQTTPAIVKDSETVKCVTPANFIGGDKALVQITFNGVDYSKKEDGMIFNFYDIHSSFPHSGPADSKNEVILVRGTGFSSNQNVKCYFTLPQNGKPVYIEQAPKEVSENIIQCPMSWPDKDPKWTGAVEFQLLIDQSQTDFGAFYYYTQITLNSIMPRHGPNEGHAAIYFFGSNFRDDFKHVEIGCKIGDEIGKGELIDTTTIRCVVEHMELVDEGQSLPVYVALNSYSWVAEQPTVDGRSLAVAQTGFVPYGIQSFFPEAGVMTGFTDVFITGKGFKAEHEHFAKCRFGTDENYSIVDADILDYYRMVCRSPKAVGSFINTEDSVSVPFGISLNGDDESTKPFTQDLSRFRFYRQPILAAAEPAEIDVRRKTEVYVTAYSGYKFQQPVPTGHFGSMDYHGTGGVSCSFGSFGTALGMYINSTHMLCLSPHIHGYAEDYSVHTETLAIAFNGQDFNEDRSYATVTFLGTGSGMGWIFKYVFTAVLVIALIIAIYFVVSTSTTLFAMENVPHIDLGNDRSYVRSRQDGQQVSRSVARSAQRSAAQYSVQSYN